MNFFNCFKKPDDKTETEQQEKDNQSTDTIPYYQLFRFATSLDILLIIIGVTASIICGILQPYLMMLFADISGIVVNFMAEISGNITEVERHLARQRVTNDTIHFAVLSSVASAVIIFCTYISSVCFTWSSLRQTFKMKKIFFEKLLYQDIGWYDQTPTGDFATVITENIPKIEDGIGDKVGIVIFLLTSFISGITWALIKGWELALICVVSFPIQLLFLTAVSKLSAKYSKQELTAYSAAGAIAEEVLSSIRTVVAFNAQEKEAKRYEIHVKNAQYNNIRRGFFNAVNQGFIFLLLYGCYALAFWYGVGLVLKQRDLPENEIVYSPGNMMGVFFLTLIAIWNFSSASPYMEGFGMACGAASKIFQILESPSVINKRNNQGKKPPLVADIVFKNVSFAYPTRNTVPILKNINIEIHFGETVAFVGHSGSGKSTMVQLLQRFYDPISGSITVDGVDLRDINLNYLRFSVGVVNQEPALFATTIAENIRYGKLDATFDEIVDAAKKAYAHKFICDLPYGYQTIIGEKGAQLSGGQKQRIAIARALIKEPNLMILDEATSALDTASEVEVQEALDAISEECTKVVVAHRLSTIRNADRIIVFDKGEIVEEGSHDQLMEAKGMYYDMVMSQGFTELKNDAENQENLNHSDNQINEKFDETKNHIIDGTDEGTAKEEINTFNVLTKIMKTNSSEWFAILIGCLASVLNGASLPLYGLIFGDIVAVLSSPDAGYVRSETNYFCLYFLYLGLATGLAMFLQIYCFGYTSEKLIYTLRNKMFASMLKQEMEWFDRKENGVGALCAQLSGDAASVQGIDGSRIGLILNSLSTLILSLVFSLYLDWRLALVAGVFLPILVFSFYCERRSTQQEAFYTQKLLKQSAKIAVECIDNIRTVKSLGCESVFYDSYMNELTECKSIGLRKCHMKSLMMGSARGLQFFAYAAGIRYGVYLLVANRINVDTLFKVLEVMITGSWSIGNALSFSTNMQKGLSAASRIFAFFDREPTIQSQLMAKTRYWKTTDINYSNINFNYASRPSVQVLNNFNLAVLNGKNVALVGSSGCGKSTAIKLLLRYYDPISGNVTIDNDDVRIMNLNCLRSQLGIVSQEPNLFDLTIAENISYGIQEREATVEETENAARAANIHNFIISLPLGYKTRIGSKGKQLSGGQKQRIAIARALMMNPKILLLDEATSALDNESEKIVQEALDNARNGKTCITIAHRLTTIQDADLICVVKDGQVVEMGAHNQLLAKKGEYYDYYKLQSGQN